jgi:hypothetical protein
MFPEMAQNLKKLYVENAQEGEVRSACHGSRETLRRRMLISLELLLRVPGIESKGFISVLDLGCGVGQLVPYVLWVDRYLGVEVLPEVAAIAADRVAQCPVGWGTVVVEDVGYVAGMELVRGQYSMDVADVAFSLAVLTSGLEEGHIRGHAEVLHRASEYFILSWNDASIRYGGIFHKQEFQDICRWFGVPLIVKHGMYSDGVDPLVAGLFKSKYLTS